MRRSHLPLLVLAVALLLCSSAAAQTPLAPYGSPTQPGPGTAPPSSLRNAASCGILEDFETYVIAQGSANNLLVLVLDDTTIANGQGPGLVLDGATYSCNGNSLQWNGAGYFGMPSKNLLANTTDGLLKIAYDNPQGEIDFTLHAFDGFPDTATVIVYDTGGTVIHNSGPINVPNSAAVPFSFTGSSIGSVDIQGGSYSWSPMIDDHEYCPGGLTLTVTGPCPGGVTLSVSGATPNGSVAVAYAFGPGNFTVPAGRPCAGTSLGLSGTGITLFTVLTADGAGNASLQGNLPAGACNRISVQVVDLSTCGTSNVVNL